MQTIIYALLISASKVYYAPTPNRVEALSDGARLTSVCRIHWA